MATTDPFNSVYQGREGTGAAFILGGNKAAEVFRSNLAYDEQMNRLAALQKQKDLQARNSLIDKNISDLKLEDHWIAHDEELRKKYTGLLNYAGQLKANGVNPTSDASFKNMQEKLNAEAKYSGQLYSGLTALKKEIQENPDKYSEESIKRALAYYDPKKPISQYLNEGFNPPTLEPKYTLSGMLKGIKGSSVEYDKNGRIIKEADRSKNVKIVEGLMDRSDFKKFVFDAGGDPNIGAFPVKTSDGKTIYSTNDEVLMPMVNDFVSKIKPEEYKNFGLSATNEDEARAQMLDIVKRQNAAYGTVVSAAADQLDAGVDSQSKKDWSGDASARGWASLRLQQQKENRIASKQAKDDEKDLKENEYLSDLKNKAISGDKDGLNRLRAHLGPINASVTHKNGVLEIMVPIEEKKSGNDVLELISGTSIQANSKSGDTISSGGKKYRRYKIGKNSGMTGSVYLDNLLKEVNLLKDNSTPKKYSGELDSIGEDETFDNL
jgi:hypothetical protein